MYLSWLQNTFVQIEWVKIDLRRLSSFSLIVFRKMYFSKLLNIFVMIAICICLYWKMYLSWFQNIFVLLNWVSQDRFRTPKNCKIYLCWLHNVFVLNANCICPDCKSYLSKLSVVKIDSGRLIFNNHLSSVTRSTELLKRVLQIIFQAVKKFKAVKVMSFLDLKNIVFETNVI